MSHIILDNDLDCKPMGSVTYITSKILEISKSFLFVVDKERVRECVTFFRVLNSDISKRHAVRYKIRI